MNLSAARSLARTLMNDYGLQDVAFSFDRGKSRFGCCHWKRMNKEVEKITFSEHLVRLNDESRVRNTILHEIAHALAGYGQHHNAKWKRIALSIGCDGRPCYSSNNTNTVPHVWEATCRVCHKVFKMHRRPSSARVCPCAAAKRALHGYEDYLLVWVNIKTHERWIGPIAAKPRQRKRVTSR